ncbi:sulfate/molybdate ABC transporter ATP-binding protein [Enterococcus alishanensis]|uniref:ATP-binding cassette domain-containing protein n=1 Tax=Enterococcus alishanensis TaxID=1303817 RepID=A0ABS6T9W1_9ENTE|nr:ATP-binding cassette domain-containing protein [Enterococcus alishanensis]MBV7389670.1 ATP-binding cassette domain-containing protein [Enterococcus alishanensis]
MSLELKIKKKLQEFTLSAEITSQDDLTALLGASGSGKSMLLKCIAGIETPDEGYIRLNGRTLFDSQKKINLKPQKRKVGILFQNYALFPNFTVRQNIASGLKKKSNQRTNQLLQQFELENIANQYGEELSGGQQQRVALARLLASEPEILLLDEPFSALDTFLKDKVELEMKNFINNYQGDVFIVTHNRNEAYRLCEKLIILHQGETLEQGDLKRIFAKPKYLATSKLTGCKNFSAIEKISDYQLRALDWGIELTTNEKISIDISYIGIRSHYFQTGQVGEQNTFEVTVIDQTESPFEIQKYCQTEYSDEIIWWEYEKNQKAAENFSVYLKISPKNIQLLKN